MAFGILLWESVILTSVALLLRDIAGIGSAPQHTNVVQASDRTTAFHFHISYRYVTLSNNVSQEI